MRRGSQQPVSHEWRLVVLCFWLSLQCIARGAESVTGSSTNLTSPTVGMEGRLETALPGTMLTAKPVDEKSLVVVRIAETRPHGALTWYDFRYVGLMPGQYDLRSSLVRKDGSTTEDLSPLKIEIGGLLPASHKGELVAQPRGLVGFFGGYRNAIILAGALWLLVSAPLFLAGRKKRQGQPAPAAPPKPTLAEKLRPLVEQAAAGELSSEGKARLERLLLSYWRERLRLEEESPGVAMAALRQHPEAGVLLRALEDWLHRPPGVARVDIQALLNPYRGPAEVGHPADLLPPRA